MQSSNWSHEQREKIRQYDRIRKKECRMASQNAQQIFRSQCPSKFQEINYKTSAKQLLMLTLKSPKKTEFLQKYLSKKGLQVQIDQDAADDSFKNETKPIKFENKEPQTKVQRSNITDKPFSILQLKSFKRQNRIADHTRMVEQIKKHYKSLKQAAKDLQVPYCTFHALCQPIETKVNQKTVDKNQRAADLRTFFELKSTTLVLPQARFCRKLYMTSTYEDSYQEYKEWCKEKCLDPVSLKSFHQLKPENVCKMSDLPDNQCTCLSCKILNKTGNVLKKTT